MSDRWTMIGGFVALAGLILYQANGATRDEIRDLRTTVTDLVERVTRIETHIEFAPPRQTESPTESPPED